MAQALLPVSRGYLIAGAAVAVGLYAIRDRGELAEQPAPSDAAVATQYASAPRPMPTLALAMPTLADEGELEEDSDEDAIEEVRGHAPIEDAAEFAMVFDVEGTSYLRLSNELRGKSHGKARMIVEGDVYSVVAPVAASALPSELAKWNGREVLVNGTCRARVIGFAEVSRASGEAPGSENYWYTPEEERPATPPTWTKKAVMADNVTLAAELDGCSGTWARSTEYQPAQVARATEEPGLETDAIADLIAKGDDDPIQDEWKQAGGEGDWRDAADVKATTFEHPTTGEKWIFVSAYEGGGCGDPSVSKMAAYRVGKTGKLHKFTDLDYAGRTISDVVDLDGDGQPELVLGEGSSSELVDLKNTYHDSIDVSFHYSGCGC